MANSTKFADTVKVKVVSEGKAVVLTCKAKNLTKTESETTGLAIVQGKFRRVVRKGKAKTYVIA